LATTGTRQAKRTPVTLKIKFKSATLDQFIERYSVDVSHGGIFIRTKDPLAVGTTLKFEFQLKDSSPLIRGEGTVVWTREHDATRAGVAPGMGVRFDRLPPESQQVLDKILTQKASKGQRSRNPSASGQFGDVPTRVAPSPLVAGLMNASSDAPAAGNMMGLTPAKGGFGGSEPSERTDATPLPSPMPFHSDLDDFPDEAFEEKTRVSALDPALVAKSAREDAGADVDDDLFGEAQKPSGRAPAVPARDELAAKRAEKERAEKQAAENKEAKAKADRDQLTGKMEADKRAAEKQLAEKRAAEEKAEADVAREGKKRAEKRATAAKDGDAKAKADTQKKPAAAKAAPDQGQDKKPAKKPAAAAPVDDAPPEKRSSGSITALLAAAVIILGVGGYVMFGMRGDDKPNKPAEPAAGNAVDDPAPTAAPDPTPAVTDTDPDPGEPAVDDAVPVETFEYEVTTIPAGANVEVVGGDQSGSSPMLLTLDQSKAHEVRVSFDGYQEQVVTVESGDKPAKIKLVEMARVLKVSSSPDGASVVVNGKRQPGVTPLTVELKGALARATTLRIGLRKSGFLNGSSTVAVGDTEWVPEDGTLVASLDLSLAERPAVAQKDRKKDPPPQKDPKKDPPKKDATDGVATADGPKKDTPKVDPKKDDPKIEPKKDEPKKDEPKKDEPKKDEPKKDEPKKDEPKKDTPDEGPTPDWMK